MALVSQMKANIEFSGGADSSAKLPILSAGSASNHHLYTPSAATIC